MSAEGSRLPTLRPGSRPITPRSQEAKIKQLKDSIAILQNERKRTKQQLELIFNYTNSASKQYELLKKGVEDSENQIKQIKFDYQTKEGKLQQFRKSQQDARKRLHQYKKVADKQTDSVGIQQFNEQIEILRREIQQKEIEYRSLIEERKARKETLTLIRDYNGLSKEMISMNKELTKEALRLLELLEPKLKNMPIDLQRLFQKLHDQLFAALYSEYSNEIDTGNNDVLIQDEDVYANIGERLENCDNFFNDLNKALDHPSQVSESGFDSQVIRDLGTSEDSRLQHTKPKVKPPSRPNSGFSRTSSRNRSRHSDDVSDKNQPVLPPGLSPSKSQTNINTNDVTDGIKDKLPQSYTISRLENPTDNHNDALESARRLIQLESKDWDDLTEAEREELQRLSSQRVSQLSQLENPTEDETKELQKCQTVVDSNRLDYLLSKEEPTELEKEELDALAKRLIKALSSIAPEEMTAREKDELLKVARLRMEDLISRERTPEEDEELAEAAQIQIDMIFSQPTLSPADRAEIVRLSGYSGVASKLSENTDRRERGRLLPLRFAELYCVDERDGRQNEEIEAVANEILERLSMEDALTPKEKTLLSRLRQYKIALLEAAEKLTEDQKKELEKLKKDEEEFLNETEDRNIAQKLDSENNKDKDELKEEGKKKSESDKEREEEGKAKSDIDQKEKDVKDEDKDKKSDKREEREKKSTTGSEEDEGRHSLSSWRSMTDDELRLVHLSQLTAEEQREQLEKNQVMIDELLAKDELTAAEKAQLKQLQRENALLKNALLERDILRLNELCNQSELSAEELEEMKTLQKSLAEQLRGDERLTELLNKEELNEEEKKELSNKLSEILKKNEEEQKNNDRIDELMQKLENGDISEDEIDELIILVSKANAQRIKELKQKGKDKLTDKEKEELVFLEKGGKMREILEKANRKEETEDVKEKTPIKDLLHKLFVNELTEDEIDQNDREIERLANKNDLPQDEFEELTNRRIVHLITAERNGSLTPEETEELKVLEEEKLQYYTAMYETASITADDVEPFVFFVERELNRTEDPESREKLEKMIKFAKDQLESMNRIEELESKGDLSEDEYKELEQLKSEVENADMNLTKKRLDELQNEKDLTEEDSKDLMKLKLKRALQLISKEDLDNDEKEELDSLLNESLEDLSDDELDIDEKIALAQFLSARAAKLEDGDEKEEVKKRLEDLNKLIEEYKKKEEEKQHQRSIQKRIEELAHKNRLSSSEIREFDNLTMERINYLENEGTDEAREELVALIRLRMAVLGSNDPMKDEMQKKLNELTKEPTELEKRIKELEDRDDLNSDEEEELRQLKLEQRVEELTSKYERTPEEELELGRIKKLLELKAKQDLTEEQKKELEENRRIEELQNKEELTDDEKQELEKLISEHNERYSESNLSSNVEMSDDEIKRLKELEEKDNLSEAEKEELKDLQDKRMESLSHKSDISDAERNELETLQSERLSELQNKEDLTQEEKEEQLQNIQMNRVEYLEKKDNLTEEEKEELAKLKRDLLESLQSKDELNEEEKKELEKLAQERIQELESKEELTEEEKKELGNLKQTLITILQSKEDLDEEEMKELETLIQERIEELQNKEDLTEEEKKELEKLKEEEKKLEDIKEDQVQKRIKEFESKNDLTEEEKKELENLKEKANYSDHSKSEKDSVKDEKEERIKELESKKDLNEEEKRELEKLKKERIEELQNKEINDLTEEEKKELEQFKQERLLELQNRDNLNDEEREELEQLQQERIKELESKEELTEEERKELESLKENLHGKSDEDDKDKILTDEQEKRLKELEEKEDLTPEEQKELQSLREKVVDALKKKEDLSETDEEKMISDRINELSEKEDLTPEEQEELKELKQKQESARSSRKDVDDLHKTEEDKEEMKEAKMEQLLSKDKSDLTEEEKKELDNLIKEKLEELNNEDQNEENTKLKNELEERRIEILSSLLNDLDEEERRELIDLMRKHYDTLSDDQISLLNKLENDLAESIETNKDSSKEDKKLAALIRHRQRMDRIKELQKKKDLSFDQLNELSSLVNDSVMYLEENDPESEDLRDLRHLGLSLADQIEAQILQRYLENPPQPGDSDDRAMFERLVAKRYSSLLGKNDRSEDEENEMEALERIRLEHLKQKPELSEEEKEELAAIKHRRLMRLIKKDEPSEKEEEERSELLTEELRNLFAVRQNLSSDEIDSALALTRFRLDQLLMRGTTMNPEERSEFEDLIALRICALESKPELTEEEKEDLEFLKQARLAHLQKVDKEDLNTEELKELEKLEDEVKPVDEDSEYSEYEGIDMERLNELLEREKLSQDEERELTGMLRDFIKELEADTRQTPDEDEFEYVTDRLLDLLVKDEASDVNEIHSLAQKRLNFLQEHGKLTDKEEKRLKELIELDRARRMEIKFDKGSNDKDDDSDYSYDEPLAMPEPQRPQTKRAIQKIKWRRRNRLHLSDLEKAALRADPDAIEKVKLIPKRIEQFSLQFSKLHSPSNLRFKTLGDYDEDDFDSEANWSPSSSPSSDAFKRHIIKRAQARKVNQFRKRSKVRESEFILEALVDEIADLNQKTKLLEFEVARLHPSLSIDTVSCTLSEAMCARPRSAVETESEMTSRAIEEKKRSIENNRRELEMAQHIKQRIFFEEQRMSTKTMELNMALDKNATLGREESELEMKIKSVKPGNEYVSPAQEARKNIEGQIEKAKEDEKAFLKAIEDAHPFIRKLRCKIDDMRTVIELRNKELAQEQKKDRPDVPKLWKQLEATKQQERALRQNIPRLAAEENVLDSEIDRLSIVSASSQQALGDLQAQLKELKEEFFNDRTRTTTAHITNPWELQDIETMLRDTRASVAALEAASKNLRVRISKYTRALTSMKIRPPMAPQSIQL